MLFLGLGTGLGSTLIVDGSRRADGARAPPVRGGDVRGLPRRPRPREAREEEVAAERRGRRGEADRRPSSLDDVVLGGGNVKKLKKLPPGCRLGDNANAFEGGFRLWRGRRAMTAATRASLRPDRRGRPSAPTPGRSRTSTFATLFADDPTRGERLTAEAAGLFLDYSKNRVTDETLKLLVRLAEESGLQSPDRRHVPGREDQRHREPGRPPRGAPRADGRLDPRRREERRPGRARGPRQDGGLLEPGPERRLEGPHREADPERRQHRNRRLGSRARHGLRGAPALQRALA